MSEEGNRVPEANPLGEVQENLLAPELYATEATSFSIVPGVVTVVLTSRRWDHGAQPPTAKRVVVARLSMPTAAAQALALGLYDFLAKQGVEFPSAGGKPLQ